MCYEVSQLAKRIHKDAVRQGADPEEIEELRKKWEQLSDKPFFYHVSGFVHPKLVAFSRHHHHFDIDTYTWGLIPHWVKDENQAHQLWNQTLIARGESIFEKPSFRDSAKSGRVIIPLDGFYEYHHKNGKAFPFYIHRKDGESLFVAGLSSEWVNQDTGEIVKSLAIITVRGNKLLSEIHNNPKLEEPRMPLIIEDSDTSIWLEGDHDEVVSLIKPIESIELEAHTVRRLKGKEYVGNSEEVQEEFIYDELMK